MRMSFETLRDAIRHTAWSRGPLTAATRWCLAWSKKSLPSCYPAPNSHPGFVEGPVQKNPYIKCLRYGKKYSSDDTQNLERPYTPTFQFLPPLYKVDRCSQQINEKHFVNIRCICICYMAGEPYDMVADS